MKNNHLPNSVKLNKQVFNFCRYAQLIKKRENIPNFISKEC